MANDEWKKLEARVIQIEQHLALLRVKPEVCQRCSGVGRINIGMTGEGPCGQCGGSADLRRRYRAGTDASLT